MSSISEIITQRRKELGLSQQYISDILGYCVQTISKWEKGKSIPSLLSWGALAKVLQIDLEALINCELKSEYNTHCVNYSFSFEKFANNLRAQRKLRNLTQKELASQLSISYQTLLAWEKGSSFPNVEQFKKLSEVLDLSYDELYFGETNLAVTELNSTPQKEQITKKRKKVKSWKIGVRTSLALALIASVVIGGSLLAGFNPFDKNHPFSSLPISDIISTPKNSVDKRNEILERPVSDFVECTRFYYDLTDETVDLGKAIVPVPFKDSTYIKSAGHDYTYQGNPFDIFSCASGVVIKKEYVELYGNMIVIEHIPKLITIYTSLGDMFVEVGQEVKKGDVIGRSGESIYTYGLRSCLHFEIMKGDMYLNPSKAYGKKLNTL